MTPIDARRKQSVDAGTAKRRNEIAVGQRHPDGTWRWPWESATPMPPVRCPERDDPHFVRVNQDGRHCARCGVWTGKSPCRRCGVEPKTRALHIECCACGKTKPCCRYRADATVGDGWFCCACRGSVDDCEECHG